MLFCNDFKLSKNNIELQENVCLPFKEFPNVDDKSVGQVCCS